MVEETTQLPVADYRNLYKSLNLKWTELCARYLPISEKDSIWCYSRKSVSADPEQGWKIHLTATILTASKVLGAVGPLLHSRKILFKAPSSLKELSKINSGVYYGYTQVGKFLTVYPSSSSQAALLARKLHELTWEMAAPSVPYEDQYRPESSVYYRYGSFKFRELTQPNGVRQLAIIDPHGNMVPDLRTGKTYPDWVKDLFPSKHRTPNALDSPLKTTYRAFSALSQRGRGGVYQALDLSSTSPRLCILKEGRRNGEVGLDGSDGYTRVKHEKSVLSLLRTAGVAVPQVYSTFAAGKNYYLVMEHIDGDNLDRWLGKRKKRLNAEHVVKFGIQLSLILSRIHAAGWAWRDCKLSNIMLTREGTLRPVDFEGACPVEKPDPLPWGTPSFTPPEWHHEFQGQSRLPEDLYALGSILYLLVTGCLPVTAPLLPVEKLRQNVPSDLSKIVSSLLSPDPKRRPSAARVARKLKQQLSSGRCQLEAASLQNGRLRRRASSANRGSERRSSNSGSLVTPMRAG